MFQQFNSIGSPSVCKMVVLHLIFSPLECSLLSQYHYINPISTEFQYTLWLASFLLLAMTNLGLCLFIFFNAAATSSILMPSAGPFFNSLHSSVFLCTTSMNLYSLSHLQSLYLILNQATQLCKPAYLVSVPSQDKLGGLCQEGHPA